VRHARAHQRAQAEGQGPLELTGKSPDGAIKNSLVSCCRTATNSAARTVVDTAWAENRMARSLHTHTRTHTHKPKAREKEHADTYPV